MDIHFNNSFNERVAVLRGSYISSNRNLILTKFLIDGCFLDREFFSKMKNCNNFEQLLKKWDTFFRFVQCMIKIVTVRNN